MTQPTIAFRGLILTEADVHLIVERMTKAVHEAHTRAVQSGQTRPNQWLPACGGTETPFTSRSGRRLQYMWNPAMGVHAYLDCHTDMILTDDEAAAYLMLT